jgi:hypothetical protein
VPNLDAITPAKRNSDQRAIIGYPSIPLRGRHARFVGSAFAVTIVVKKYESPRARGQVVERQKIAKEIYDYWSKLKGFFPTTGR